MNKSGSTGMAARMMAWQMNNQNLPGPLIGASTLPFLENGHTNIKFEMKIGGSWTEITNRVRAPGGTIGFAIERGRSNWQSRSNPQLCDFSINNADGLFCNDNPTSPYYGLLPNNTQIRLSVGTGNYRFVGEIKEFPQRWDNTGNDVWIPIQATGIRRRLTTRAKPILSAMRRTLSTIIGDIFTDGPPTAYWPCEDGANSSRAISGLEPTPPVPSFVPGEFFYSFADVAQPMQVVGPVTFAAGEGPPGSAPLPSFSGSTAQLIGFSPNGDPDLTEGAFMVEFAVKIDPISSGICNLVRMNMYSGTLNFVDIKATTLAGGGIYVAWQVSGVADDSIGVATAQAFDDGQWHWINLIVTQGDPCVWQLSVDGPDNVITSGSMAGGSTTYNVKKTTVNPTGSTALNMSGFGHLTIWRDFSLNFSLGNNAFNGLEGESVADRIARLCTEKGIGYQIVGINGDTELVGPQQVKTFYDLLDDASDVDQGDLFESRAELTPVYRTRKSKCNQDMFGGTLQLNYGDNHLSGAVFPTNDDQYSINKSTIIRLNGSSGTYELTTGPRSSTDPPDGIGLADEQLTWNLYTDDQTEPAAQWRVNLGTSVGKYYPTLEVDLSRSPFRSNTNLTNQVIGLDIGDWVSLVNPTGPALFPGNQRVDLIVAGYKELITAFQWIITFNLLPAEPYRTFVFRGPGQIYGRLTDDGTSTLTDSIDSSATSLSVTTPTGHALWSTNHVPYDIVIGGETMIVTAVSGASSPQTFTVTRSLNGIVKSHNFNSKVELLQRAKLAL